MPNCERTAHTKFSSPAAGKLCNGCKQTGNFQSLCLKTRAPKNERLFASKVKQLKLHRTSLQSPSPTVTVSTQLNPEPLSVPLALWPDTGSDVDAIGFADLYKLGGYPENLDDDDDDARTADGTRLRATGSIVTKQSANGRTHNTAIHIYDGLHDALLSRQFLQTLGFLPDNWPHRLQVARIDLPERDPTPAEINKIRADLVSELADVFSESIDKLKPMVGPDMDISLEPDAKTHRVYIARPIPHAYCEEIKQQIGDMGAEGIIEPVTELTDWCHPIVVVDKKNSSGKRLTVDFKSLNSQVSGGAVANRLRRRTSDQTVLGWNPAVAAALSPWTRLFTPIVPRRSLHISLKLSGHPCKIYTGKKKKRSQGTSPPYGHAMRPTAEHRHLQVVYKGGRPSLLLAISTF